MLNTIEIHWDLLGAKLAALSADEQAQFFTGFARELSGFDTHYHREVQMMYAGEKMAVKDKLVLAEYLPSLWFKDAPDKA